MSEKKPNIIALLADQYHLEPDEFVRTVKATCGLQKATAEEFLTFLIAAKEHDLNPLMREIYAYPKQGGGIQVIVGVDGWLKLMNRNPFHDGIETKEILGASGELIAVLCRVWRKDRKVPVVATEYLKECRRNTDPWRNMPSRMLTHRAKVQAIRTAYGLAGLLDEDEALEYLERLKAQPTNVVDATQTPLDEIAATLPDASDAKPQAQAEVVIEPEHEPEPEPPIEEPVITEEQRDMLQSAVVIAGWTVKAIPEVILIHAGCPLEQIKASNFMTVMNAIHEAGKKKKARLQAVPKENHE